MRILMLNYEFPPIGGGGGVSSWQLARGFVQQGYTVDCVTSHMKGLPLFEQMDGINVHRVRVLGRKASSTASMASMSTFLPVAYKKVRKLQRQHSYSFLNTHFALPTGPLGIMISRNFNLTNILSIHGGDIYDPTKKSSPHNKNYLQKTVKWVLNNSDQIVAQSSNTRDNAYYFYHPTKNIDVIPLPYEQFKFSSVNRDDLGLNENTTYIIGIGRLVKRKGFEHFLKTLSQLPSNIEGLILGEGPERENLLQLARELDIANRVHLLGNVSEELKFQYLENSDIYFLSSLHEGFGIVLQEAMQVGLPIVATNNGGQIDFIKNGENGLLTNVGDYKDSADKILYLLNNLQVKSDMGYLNQNLISNYSPSTIASNYLSLSSIR